MRCSPSCHLSANMHAPSPLLSREHEPPFLLLCLSSSSEATSRRAASFPCECKLRLAPCLAAHARAVLSPSSSLARSTNDVTVNDAIAVVVEDEGSIAAFKDYTGPAAAAALSGSRLGAAWGEGAAGHLRFE